VAPRGRFDTALLACGNLLAGKCRLIARSLIEGARAEKLEWGLARGGPAELFFDRPSDRPFAKRRTTVGGSP